MNQNVISLCSTYTESQPMGGFEDRRHSDCFSLGKIIFTSLPSILTSPKCFRSTLESATIKKKSVKHEIKHVGIYLLDKTMSLK